MFWRLGGQFGGGWGVVWCKLRVPPKIAKIRLRIIRVCRINGVLTRMGRRKSPYDVSLQERDFAHPFILQPALFQTPLPVPCFRQSASLSVYPIWICPVTICR